MEKFSESFQNRKNDQKSGKLERWLSPLFWRGGLQQDDGSQKLWYRVLLTPPLQTPAALIIIKEWRRWILILRKLQNCGETETPRQSFSPAKD
jgi:hypothetical protein